MSVSEVGAGGGGGAQLKTKTFKDDIWLRESVQNYTNCLGPSLGGMRNVHGEREEVVLTSCLFLTSC